ncbi:MAG: VTC domain-containing protein [Myxococcales bacterium]|nr:VTC domain-containing protein [Myxococcales bacterium]
MSHAVAPRHSVAPRRLTGVRQEVKHLLTPAQGSALAQAISQHVPIKTHGGFDHSWRISIYLDTPDFSMAHRALIHGSQTTKLRAKQYYNYKNGAEVYDDTYWLESKTRARSMVEKMRFRAPKADIPDILAYAAEKDGVSPEEATARLSFDKFRQGAPLLPLFIAHYRRYTYQDADSTLRITLDDACTFHLPPQGLFTSQVPVASRRHLPPPLAAESQWILEIKTVGVEPDWLAALTEDIPTVDFSKFVAGVCALHRAGRLPDAPAPQGEENICS